MIELPSLPAPNGVEVTPVDFGHITSPASGSAALRVDRPGNRYRVSVSWPPMRPNVARIFYARLQRAKREGLRIDVPLLDEEQGIPGSPVVDGAGQAGTTLALTGLTPYYALREGYWLTLIDDDDARYLHCCTVPGVADLNGDLSIGIEPPLRAPFPNNATVLLAKPTIEGNLPGELNWSLSLDRFVRGGSITIEEAA